MIKSRHLLRTLAALFLLQAFPQPLSEALAANPPLHPSLDRRVLCGYQGWLRTPKDFDGAGWRHCLRQRKGVWLPLTDYLPDVSESEPGERCRMPLICTEGGFAEAVSADNRNTVNRHFGWMKEYGIDGVFVQRFPVDLYHHSLTPSPSLASSDRVLGYCRDAAAANGRSYSLMYDLSGLTGNAAEVVMADWRHLLAAGVVRGTNDVAWQFHNGKPVIALWGIGFNDNRQYGLDACERLIDFFKGEGCAVLLGLPFYWRTLKSDTVADVRLHALVRKADIVHSWSVGRFRDEAGVRHAETVWRDDAAWCRENGLAFMPVAFPGFSWYNLKGTDHAIPRRDGAFLWSQFAAAQRAGAGCAFVAMFDEVDEGTQIFKINNAPPKGEGFTYLSYGSLPTDHYLWLTGEATRLFHSQRPFPAVMPKRE
jgi:hypothetical protein